MKKCIFFSLFLLFTTSVFADAIIDSLKKEMEKNVIEQNWQLFNDVMWAPGWKNGSMQDLDFKGAAKSAYEFYKERIRCKPILESGKFHNGCISRMLSYANSLEERTIYFTKDFKLQIDADLIEMKNLASAIRDGERKAAHEKHEKENKWRKLGVWSSEIKNWEALGLDVEAAEKWISINQSLYDIQSWIKNGVNTVDSATLWINLGVKSEHIDKWAKLGIEIAQKWVPIAGPEKDVSAYIEAGAEPESLNGWLDVSYAWGEETFSADNSYEEIKSFNQNHVSPSFAIAMKSQNMKANDIVKQWKKIKKQCKDIYSQEDLRNENPYATKGKCYEFSGSSIQILSKNSGLFEGSSLYYVSLPSGVIPKSVIGVVKSTGAYVYKSTRGAKEIVPNLSLIQYVPYTE